MTALPPNPAPCVPPCSPEALESGLDALDPGGADTRRDSAPALLSHVARLCRTLAGAFEDLARLEQIRVAGTGGVSVMDGDVSPTSKTTADAVPGRLLSTKDLSRVFGVEEKTIRRWREDGRLPDAIEIGGTVRWHAGVLDSWLRGGAR